MSNEKTEKKEELVEVEWFEEEEAVSSVNATAYLAQFGIFTR